MGVPTPQAAEESRIAFVHARFCDIMHFAALKLKTLASRLVICGGLETKELLESVLKDLGVAGEAAGMFLRPRRGAAQGGGEGHGAGERRAVQEGGQAPAGGLHDWEYCLISLKTRPVWPVWAASVAPGQGGGLAPGEEGTHRRPGRKRPSGGARPTVLGLAETADLRAEVARWRELLDSCTARLSILQGLAESLAG